MSDDKLYTIRDLAKELGSPESTVRHWKNQFEEFVPSVGEGKRKRYRKTAIDVLRFVRDRLNRNESQDEIRRALSLDFPKNIDITKEGIDQNRQIVTTQQDRNTASDPALVNELKEFVQGVLQRQDRRIEFLEAENRELRERLARLEEREQTAIPQRGSAPGQYREKVIAYLVQLRTEGMSYRGIATRLNEEGISGLHGGRWDGKTVARILRKEGIE
jgi:DNA-binding transcriptional MerR regulator